MKFISTLLSVLMALLSIIVPSSLSPAANEFEETRHWWVCGFDMGNPLPPEELEVYGTIQFEDENMMNAFIEAAKEFENELTVTADDMKVNIIWK